VVVCLEQGADSCFSKIQIGFTFLVPAHLGSPGKRAVKIPRRNMEQTAPKLHRLRRDRAQRAHTYVDILLVYDHNQQN